MTVSSMRRLKLLIVAVGVIVSYFCRNDRKLDEEIETSHTLVRRDTQFLSE